MGSQASSFEKQRVAGTEFVVPLCLITFSAWPPCGYVRACRVTYPSSAAREKQANALSLFASTPLPLAMASEPNAPVPTATVDNSAAVVVNGSVDGDVIPNGDVMPNGDGVSLTAPPAPPAHDQIANAGTAEYMACSLNLLTVVLKIQSPKMKSHFTTDRSAFGASRRRRS